MSSNLSLVDISPNGTQTLLDELINSGYGEEMARSIVAAEIQKYLINNLAAGILISQLEDELVGSGWTLTEAQRLVKRANDERITVRRQRNYQPLGTPQQERSKNYERHMLYGFLWMAGGGLVSLTSYGYAGGGGVYFLFYGAIIWGAIDFIIGLMSWLGNRFPNEQKEDQLVPNPDNWIYTKIMTWINSLSNKPK